MTSSKQESYLETHGPDAAGIVSWIHIGDLHMTRAGEQNHLDLAAIVTEINQVFAGKVSFAYLPGDVADDGSRAAYAVVRGELDRLKMPWCAIIGDHDVHEKSFTNFHQAMFKRSHYAFSVGRVRFIAMNAFDVPDPGSFMVGANQLSWVKDELAAASEAGQIKVLLLHCYPSDLKKGRQELVDLLRTYEVSLIDMGHTHYNELACDGKTIYSATRSTGQIEEGPVGYSITNIDSGVTSWRFVELGKLPVVVITSPIDERLTTDTNRISEERVVVRAKFWGSADAVEAIAAFDGQVIAMQRIESSQVWEAQLPRTNEGVCPLKVSITDALGRVTSDEIRIRIGPPPSVVRHDRDQDNAIGAWPAHGLLGTQLGPNKNGKKW